MIEGISRLQVEIEDIDLARYGVEMHDHPTFDQANEIFALSQPPAGKGRVWCSVAFNDYTAVMVLLMEGMIWYDDVRQHMGTWRKFLQIILETTSRLKPQSPVSAISFTCSAVSEALTEYRATYSFTHDSARLGVLPVNRWDWTWTDLHPDQTVQDIQRDIFQTEQEPTS